MPKQQTVAIFPLHVSDKHVQSIDVLIGTPFTWSQIENILTATSHQICVKFALSSIERLLSFQPIGPCFYHGTILKNGSQIQIPYNLYAEHAVEVINSINDWLYNPTNKTLTYIEFLRDATFLHVVSCAFDTVLIPNPAHFAAETAWTCLRMLDKVDSNIDTFKQEQMNYLRNLILESLTDEQKESWLLLASI